VLGKVAEKPVEEEAYPPETAGPLLFSRPSHNRPEHGFLRTASESVIFPGFPAMNKARFERVTRSYAAARAPSKKRRSSVATTWGLFRGIKCPESTITTLDCGINVEARCAKPSGTALSREP
jgi:hypothetical protein